MTIRQSCPTGFDVHSLHLRLPRKQCSQTDKISAHPVPEPSTVGDWGNGRSTLVQFPSAAHAEMRTWTKGFYKLWPIDRFGRYLLRSPTLPLSVELPGCFICPKPVSMFMALDLGTSSTTRFAAGVAWSKKRDIGAPSLFWQLTMIFNRGQSAGTAVRTHRWRV